MMYLQRRCAVRKRRFQKSSLISHSATFDIPGKLQKGPFCMKF